MLNNLSLGIVLLAKDEFSKVFKQLDTAFVSLEGRSDEFMAKMAMNGKQLKMGLAAMGTGIAGLGAAFVAANAAGKFEGAMTNLQVIAGGTTEQMKAFKEAILGADKSMFGPVESAAAMQELAQRGFTARQALEMLKPVTDLATASLGQLGLTDAAEVATMAIHGFGLKAEDTTQVVDMMAKAANMSGMAFKDLPLGVGAIARGAQAANQTLEESLIVLGMMRNSIHSIERASNAGSVAMERMVAGTKGSKELQAMVNVFDKVTGQVRPFREIVNDLIPKLDAMGVAASKAFIIKAFGTRGLAGVQAVITQLKNGVEKADGTIVKGIDLINYQNEQLSNSVGQAAKIAEAKMSTLPGQIDLVKASFERLMTIVGEPFANVLKPITTGLLTFITFLSHAFMSMPTSVQNVIAGMFLLGSAVLTAVGALIAGKAIMVLFGVTLAGMGTAAVALLPLIAGIGVSIGAVVLMVQALRVNSLEAGGGVLGFFIDMGHKISLGWRGLMQLFQQGGFSGEVMKELNKAENSGVEAFAIKVYLWANRIKNFLAGLAAGFKERIKELKPTFDVLIGSLGMITAAFGLNVGAADENRQSWQDAGKEGMSLGRTLANLARLFAEGLTLSILLASLAIDVLKEAWKSLGPIALGALKIVLGGLQVITGFLAEDWTNVWGGALKVVYGMANASLKALAPIAKFLSMLMIGNDSLGSSIESGIASTSKWLKENEQEGMKMAGINPSLTFEQRLAKITAGDTTIIPTAAGPSSSNSPMIGLGETYLSRALAEKPMAAAAPVPQTINLHSTTTLDGATIARTLQVIRADLAARGFQVTPVAP